MARGASRTRQAASWGSISRRAAGASGDPSIVPGVTSGMLALDHDPTPHARFRPVFHVAGGYGAAGFGSNRSTYRSRGGPGLRLDDLSLRQLIRSNAIGAPRSGGLPNLSTLRVVLDAIGFLGSTFGPAHAASGGRYRARCPPAAVNRAGNCRGPRRATTRSPHHPDLRPASHLRAAPCAPRHSRQDSPSCPVSLCRSRSPPVRSAVHQPPRTVSPAGI